MINLKIKKLHENFVMPSKAHPGDACYDLTAASRESLHTSGKYPLSKFGFGFSTEIPSGYCALIFMRSSGSKKDETLGNCVGIIDSLFRGEWSAVFRSNLGMKSSWDRKTHDLNKVGERIAQFMIIPTQEINFQLVENLEESSRGSGSYGSSGK